MRHLRTLLAGLLALATAACAGLPIAPRGPLDAEASYTALYPYYLEFCALSEIQKLPGYGADIRGGVGGHSTVYLNGACLAGPGYPELRVCDGPNPGADGVGLSVNAHFANANWAAIPGRDFFYHGDLKPGQPLTRAAYDATKAHAKRLGLYDAIRFHDVVFADLPPGYPPDAQGRDAFKYEVSIGTDYAIGYGRDRYCARVPVDAAEMGRITAYLNALNRPYRDGLATYVWSVLTDNCIHLAHNALTAIGFWPEWPTHQFVLFAAFDSRSRKTSSSTCCAAPMISPSTRLPRGETLPRAAPCWPGMAYPPGRARSPCWSRPPPSTRCTASPTCNLSSTTSGCSARTKAGSGASWPSRATPTSPPTAGISRRCTRAPRPGVSRWRGGARLIPPLRTIPTSRLPGVRGALLRRDHPPRRPGPGLKLPVRPLAITASCIVTSLGAGRPATLAALQSGASGLAACRFETVNSPTHVGEVAGLDNWRIEGELARFDSRNNRLARLSRNS